MARTKAHFMSRPCPHGSAVSNRPLGACGRSDVRLLACGQHRSRSQRPSTEATGAPVQRRFSGGQAGRNCASRRTASTSTSSRLQNANRTSVRPASASSWNTETGTPTTPAAPGNQ